MARLRPGGDTNKEISGRAGAEPPPGAPHEVSQQLAPNAGGIVVYDRDTHQPTGEVLTPQALARAHERELAPLTYGKAPAGSGVAESVDAAKAGKLDPFYERLAVTASQPVPAAPAPTTGRPAGRISRAVRQPAARPPVPEEGSTTNGAHDQLRDLNGLPAGGAVVHSGDAQESSQGQVADGEPPIPTVDSALIAPSQLPRVNELPPEMRATMPAASDTDSPTRGIPRDTPGVTHRPGKEITGGFGDAASLQYFALDGGELGVLVIDMLGELAARVQNDLRFNPAIVYPRVGVRCVVEVTAFAADQDFIVDKFEPDGVTLARGVPMTQAMALATARQIADEVCFVLIAAKEETDAEGNTVDAPDAIRVQLGLTRPRKQFIVGAGGQRQIVDVR